MILFKACPRCGGDVDVTYYADSFCFQCAYRPTVVYPGPRVVGAAARWRRHRHGCRRPQDHWRTDKSGDLQRG